MKLKTTAILAALGVLVSAAGAFAIPVSPEVVTPDTFDPTGDKGPNGEQVASRMTAGDTLLVDARLGHASLAKAGPGETFLFADVAAAEDALAAQKATPVNLAIVVDRSGSMKGGRIANAMDAAVSAVERMREGDSVTVVSFDTRAEVVVPPTQVTKGARPSIEAAIRRIRLGGDTCISCGLTEAMHQLDRSTLGGDRINRMILLSDGEATAGIRSASGLRGMAGRMRGKGVTISTIGVDVDFDEKIMAAIANEANGRHYFVANAAGLPAVFAQEFDDLLASVAKEAELRIELAPGVEVEQVFDRSFRREGDALVVPFGTFSAKQEKTVLVKLKVPTDKVGAERVADVKLTYRDLLKKTDGSCAGDLSLAIRDDGAEQKDLDPFVAARLERSRTVETLTEANALFEAGRVQEAQDRLAQHRAELKKRAKTEVARARALPAKRPRRSAPLDRDFAAQIGAVSEAEARFAAPPPAAGAGRGSAPVAAAPATREGKAQVRKNQQAASNFAF